ncbi:sensor histidine kinase [Symbioplanes lichenis]|uniref:sensor histidine kinase n=1 Tax=Symbioplanes lichenis TaxID=1629072 RepID=UPI0027381AF5|nr:HAMP domain-containing sensor histidine kinase [Actinoplanes lichenis]
MRLRLAVAAVATVTLVHVLQFLYYRLNWPWLYYNVCNEDINGLACRVTRKIPLVDLTGYAVVLGVALLVLVPLGWWVLAPIRRLVPVVDQLGPQNLGYRVRPGRRGRDEGKRLGRALDAMMDRIASGYEGQRAFAANASHELRTPLALQRTLIEVGMAEQLTPEQSALLTSQLLATNTRNERLIEGLLVLAQADQGLAARTPQDLDRITRAVIDANAAFAGANDVKVSTAVYPYRVPGDGILLERLVRNLVHNATKYNHPGGTVRVTVDGVLIVENTGPVVPPEDVARLFEPFTRLAAARIDHSGGSGLGLAIARSIVQAHDGTITADPVEGGGLRFTVRLPPV